MFDTTRATASTLAPHTAQHLAPTLRMHAEPPTLSPSQRVRLVPAGPALWRVLDVPGRIIGHLQERPDPLGTKWDARRYHDRSGSFRTVGEFWSVDDAVAALRGS